MIEILAGVLVLAAAVALAMGVGDSLMLTPVLGLGSYLTIAAAGAALVAHGAFRRLRDHGTGNRYWLRTGGLLWAVLGAAAILTFLLPAATAHLGLFKISGFPLGYYAAAQGALIGLAILMFCAARKQDRIEWEDAGNE